MTIPTLTTLPVAPARTDPPATFVTRADAFLAAIVTFQGEMNTSIGAMNTDIAGVNANAIAAQAAQTAAELAETNAETAESNASTSETNAQIYAAAAQAAAGVPSLVGNALKKLSVNAAEDGVEWVEVQSDPTLGTLTKTFLPSESSTISLTSSVLAPVVSVTKEVPQSGVTNNSWDVNSNTENYTRIDSSYATTLDFVSSLDQASYTRALSVTSQDADPEGLTFNSDGTKLFVVGRTGDAVYEYDLTTGFDLSTATYSQSFSVASQDGFPRDVVFNNDGTSMFVMGDSTNTVYQYTLTTGFDVSTASYASKSFVTTTQEDAPQALSFNTDGTKMFVVGSGTDTVYEYTLTTGFDVSTASYSSNSFSVTSQDTNPSGLFFSSDGTRMYIVGLLNDTVYKYNLTTAFDITTASLASDSFSVASQDGTPNGIVFNSDETKMFVVGNSNNSVYEYSVGYSSLALGTGSFASADVGKTIEANSGVLVLTATDGSYVETTAPTSYAQVASGSWSMYGVVYNATDGDLELSGYSETYGLTNASYASINFNLQPSQGETPTSIRFNNDGSKMFVVNNLGQDVNEYTLSTNFNVSTATFVDAFSVSGQETQPHGLAFNSDGTKMFVCGLTGDDVNEYSLSTAFDVSTASFTDAFSVSSQETSPTGITFNNDGTKMFVIGTSGDAVNEYTLSTGFDVSTATFVDSFSVAGQASNPMDVVFSTDGTKMLVAAYSSQDILLYTLTTGFDVSTASYTSALDVSAVVDRPHGLTFNNDGSKMFIVDNTTQTVYEYTSVLVYITSGYQPVHTTSSIDSTYWTDINSMTADQNAGDGNIYYAISTDDRTTWTVIDNTDGERDIVRNNSGTWQYNSNGTYASQTWVNGATNTELATLAEAMEGAESNPDLANAVFSNSFSVSSQDSTPAGVCFNTTGTKMFVVGGTSPDSVYEYTLSIAFNVATSSFVDSFDVSSQDIRAKAIAFNANGTKMFVVGSTNDSVFEYNLSASFDVSSASYSQSFSVASQETDPQGLAFNTNGTKMFVVGSINDSVFEYNLSSGFDVSSASYSQSFSVSAKEGSTTGVAFNTDGTQMFVVGNSSDAVHQYNLSTGFDVSSAVFSKSFSVSSQDIDPQDITFSADGSKMFIVGETNASVYQYALTSYINQMDKTQLDAVTDPNHIALGNDLDLAIVFNMTSGSTVPSSDGVAINYDANVLNKGAVLGTDYDFDAPTQSSVRITALAGNNLKVRVV